MKAILSGPGISIKLYVFNYAFTHPKILGDPKTIIRLYEAELFSFSPVKKCKVAIASRCCLLTNNCSLCCLAKAISKLNFFLLPRPLGRGRKAQDIKWALAPPHFGLKPGGE